MNKDRRQRLSDAIDTLEEAVDIIQEVYDEEDEAFNNMPDGLQCGRTGDSMQDAMDKMDDFMSDIGAIQRKIQAFVSNKTSNKANSSRRVVSMF